MPTRAPSQNENELASAFERWAAFSEEKDQSAAFAEEARIIAMLEAGADCALAFPVSRVFHTPLPPRVWAIRLQMPAVLAAGARLGAWGMSESEGCEWMRWAIARGDGESLGALAQLGVGVGPGPNGENAPLFEACHQMQAGLVERLLDMGAHPDQEKTSNAVGNRPMHTAVYAGLADDEERALKIAQILVARGAPVDSIGRDRMTPLHFAFASGRVKIARWLLENGANPCFANQQGQTPWAMAQEGAEGHLWREKGGAQNEQERRSRLATLAALPAQTEQAALAKDLAARGLLGLRASDSAGGSADAAAARRL